MRIMISKNLLAHRRRNLLTSIIYALTLGCIVFLVVSANLQLKQITNAETIGDADIILSSIGDFNSTIDNSAIYASDVESVLVKYASDIKDFGYITGELQHLNGDLGYNKVKDTSGITEKKTSV